MRDTNGDGRIPVAPPTPALDMRQGRPLPAEREPPTVLLVDDDVQVLQIIERALRLLLPGARILVASDPETALDHLGTARIDAIVTDHYLGRMDGVTLLAIAQRIQPRASRMLITGAIERGVAVRAVNEGRAQRYFEKPARVSDIADAVREAVGA